MANFSFIELCFLDLCMPKSGVQVTNIEMWKHLNGKRLFTGFISGIFKDLF